jgi:hypothetical protein
MTAKTLTADKMIKSLRKEFDVEYVGGVGFCGPRWQEAQAAFNAWRKEVE